MAMRRRRLRLRPPRRSLRAMMDRISAQMQRRIDGRDCGGTGSGGEGIQLPSHGTRAAPQRPRSEPARVARKRLQAPPSPTRLGRGLRDARHRHPAANARQAIWMCCSRRQMLSPISSTSTPVAGRAMARIHEISCGKISIRSSAERSEAGERLPSAMDPAVGARIPLFAKTRVGRFLPEIRLEHPAFSC